MIKKIAIIFCSINLLLASSSYGMKIRPLKNEKELKEEIVRLSTKLQKLDEQIERTKKLRDHHNKIKNDANTQYQIYTKKVKTGEEKIKKIDIKEKRSLWERINNQISQNREEQKKKLEMLMQRERELREKQDSLTRLQQKRKLITDELKFLRYIKKEFEFIEN